MKPDPTPNTVSSSRRYLRKLRHDRPRHSGYGDLHTLRWTPSRHANLKCRCLLRPRQWYSKRRDKTVYGIGYFFERQCLPCSVIVSSQLCDTCRCFVFARFLRTTRAGHTDRRTARFYSRFLWVFDDRHLKLQHERRPRLCLTASPVASGQMAMNDIGEKMDFIFNGL